MTLTFRLSWLAPTLLLACALWQPQSAHAGVPECGGLRLEDAGRCEVRGNIQCSGGCSEFGIYKKACATRLHTSCRETCTLSAMPTCTDECTEICQTRCDAGEDITCIHNCFGECSGSCTASCEGAEDLDTCMASCEATCDGECDVKCAPLVSASCYEHCLECCDGSCGAQANMDCQTTCQEVQFEECEHELRIECDASCSGDGALFCDGEYALSGDEIGGCVQALIARGIMAQAEVEARVESTLEEIGDGIADTKGSVNTSAKGCAVHTAGGHGWQGLWPFVAVWFALRRRRSNSDAR